MSGGWSWASLKARAAVATPRAPLTACQAQAADLGQRYAENTNYAVAVGLDYTVERTKAALAKVGADKAGEACLSVAEKSLAASRLVPLTRAAVEATGRALEATGRAAEKSGALRLGEATGAALQPALAASAATLSASVGATAAAAERAVALTAAGAGAAAALGGRAAAALPALSGLGEELKGLSVESNARMLAALYPGWSGEGGCAQLLCALESQWAAVAAAQAEQAAALGEAESAAGEAAQRVADAGGGWLALQREAGHLPGLVGQLAQQRRWAEDLLSSAAALADALAAAEAGCLTHALREREARLARNRAAAAARDAAALEAARELARRRRAAAADEAKWAALRGAPHAEPAEPAGLLALEGHLAEATQRLRRFLETGPGGPLPLAQQAERRLSRRLAAAAPPARPRRRPAEEGGATAMAAALPAPPRRRARARRGGGSPPGGGGGGGGARGSRAELLLAASRAEEAAPRAAGSGSGSGGEGDAGSESGSESEAGA